MSLQCTKSAFGHRECVGCMECWPQEIETAECERCGNEMPVGCLLYGLCAQCRGVIESGFRDALHNQYTGNELAFLDSLTEGVYLTDFVEVKMDDAIRIRLPGRDSPIQCESRPTIQH